MVVLISGATGGLGAPVTRACLEAGHSVVAAARSEGALARLAGSADAGAGTPDPEASTRLIVHPADVTRAGDVAAWVDAALAAHGRIDALLHLAGGYGESAVADTDEAAWDHLLALNLKSAFLCARAVLPQMLRQGHGRIVGVASRAALAGEPELSAYCASKAGLIRLLESIAAESRGKGITANAILPGIIDTPDNRKAMPRADTSRWTPPERIADVILWLLSDAAAAVTGAQIPV